MVPREGLEPPRPSALDPKSSVSANFTSGAIKILNKKINLTTKKIH